MTQKSLNLITESPYLSGKERARLIIKDAHEKTFGSKRGFLSDTEIKALLRMPDYQVSEEYDKYVEIYGKTPLIMGTITEAYLRFKYFYESLKKAHLLLNLSPAIEYLTGIIKDEIKDKKKKKEALKIIDLIQMVKISDDGKLHLKDSLNFIKKTVPKVFEQACYFVSMKRIVDRINEELGFNVFIGKSYNEAYQIYIKEVGLCIKEHNRIMNEKAGKIENIEDYLIAEPTYNTNVYEEWTEIVFKEKPKDV
jgi:hypothetical protein